MEIVKVSTIQSMVDNYQQASIGEIVSAKLNAET